MKLDYEIKFWKDYVHSDHLERLKLVEKLPLRKMLKDLETIKSKKITDKMKAQMIAQLLNGYFEDLESAVYVKMNGKSRNKSKS
jgi:hypothetical protein